MHDDKEVMNTKGVS